MRLNKLLNAVAGAALFASTVGCSDSSFNSDASPAVSPRPSPQKPGLPANPLPTGPLDYDQGGIRGPQACEASSLKEGAAGRCPDNHAVFGIDDPGSGVTFGTLACCPLPALNIFKGTATSHPGRSCPKDEILVGNDNAGNVKCRAINTDVYKLADAQVCYFGSGSTGRGSALTCESLKKDGIPAAFAAIARKGGMMGDDGCLNYPYGSLSVAQNGKLCSNQEAKQLLRKDGTPLIMFK